MLLLREHELSLLLPFIQQNVLKAIGGHGELFILGEDQVILQRHKRMPFLVAPCANHCLHLWRRGPRQRSQLWSRLVRVNALLLGLRSHENTAEDVINILLKLLCKEVVFSCYRLFFLLLEGDKLIA